jgi:uncharacterized membrane protein
VNSVKCVWYETNADEGLKKGFAEQHDEVATMLLRGLAALLFLSGLVYALVSGNWGIGAIVFSLGVTVLGLNQLRVAQNRPDRAIGWVLVLTSVLTIAFTAIRIAIGAA